MTSTMAPTALIANNDNITDDGNGTSAADCSYDEPPLTTLRFWVVTVFGTTIALCSIVENLFFSYLFASRRHHRSSFNLYMMFIALFDIFISTSYILIQSMNVLMDFLQSLTLFRIWHIYMIPFLTISHCAITSGSFLILAATIERYLLTANASKYIRFVQRRRLLIIMAAIGIGIASKVTICLEFKISYKEECANTMNELDIGFADFAMPGTNYALYWRFYYRNYVTVFFPFVALLILNAKIISVLAKYEKENYKFQMLHSATATAKQIKRKKVTRAATVTTILVVCTYLVSNIISVALTTWEHIDKSSLIGEYIQIYFISIDLTSLMTVCSCAFRPLIYLICQPALRKEVFALLKGACGMRRGSRNADFSTRAGTQFTGAGFEPMYNSNEISTPSCMHPSPSGSPYGSGKPPLALPGTKMAMAYPLVPRRPTLNSDLQQRVLLQLQNNNNVSKHDNNNTESHAPTRRTSLGVDKPRRRSSQSRANTIVLTNNSKQQQKFAKKSKNNNNNICKQRRSVPQLQQQQQSNGTIIKMDQHRRRTVAQVQDLQRVREVDHDGQITVAEEEHSSMLGYSNQEGSTPPTPDLTPPRSSQAPPTPTRELLRNIQFAAGGDETHL